MNFYNHHLGDYLRDTAHLTLLEHGCYRRMLDVYYTKSRSLPANVDSICRLIGAVSRDEKTAVNTVLNEFFLLAEDGWHQPRADMEIERYREKSAKAAESAKVRWRK